MKRFLVYSALYVFTVAIIAAPFILVPHETVEYPVLRSIIIFFASVLLTKYLVYMLVAPWHDVIRARHALKSSRRRSAGTSQPLVSVIIPAWNEEVGLLATVKTVLANEYKRVEVIVVNDGSTDNSDSMMKAFVSAYRASDEAASGMTIHYFYKENGGKGRALNYGIEQATGDIIMTIDADCALTPSTIGNFVACFDDPTVMAAVGNVKIGNTDTILGTIQYLEFLFSFYFKKTESVMNTIYIIGGAAGAFRREVFEKVGLYNHANITEDIELSVRIQDQGMRIVYASDAVVYTEGASSLTGLMKQRLRWKRGRFQTFWQHKHLFLSLRSHHNKPLSWIILPLALFGELQLLLEIPFLAFLYVYSYLTADYSSFLSGIIVVSSMFFVQVFFDDHSTKRLRFYLLAPIGWLLFYVSTFVEYNALIKSVWGSLRKQELVWQKWERKGCIQGETSVV